MPQHPCPWMHVVRFDAKVESTGRRVIMRVVVALALVSAMATAPVSAQSVCWTEDGVEVAGLASPTTVTDVTTIPDGTGGLYVAWSDDRNGTYDIYMSRLDANGVRMAPWPYQGLQVCTAVGQQRMPRLALDNAGGVYVAWEDSRTGTSDVYLQRFAGNGTVAAGWPLECVMVCEHPGNQVGLDLSVQGTSSVFLSWRNEASLWYMQLYAQKLAASNGAAQWNAGGRWIAELGGYSDGAKIVPDGVGGAFICWQIGNAGSVMLQRLSAATGDFVWGTWPYPGVVVYAGDYRPQMVSDGAGGVWVAADSWVSPPGHYDVGAVRYNADGTPIADALFTTTADEIHNRLTPDGAGGVVMAWVEASGSNYSVAVTRVTANGSMACVPGGRTLIPTGSYPPQAHELAGDGHGGAMVVWSEGVLVRGRHFKADGSLGTQLTLCDTPGYKYQLSVGRTGAGKIAAAWADGRSGAYRAAYAQCASYAPVAPAGLTDLHTAGVASRGLTLQWTVPDDQPPYGSATQFEVRYAGGPITEQNFENATLVSEVPAWGGPGTPMCLPVAPLALCQTYYFAIRTTYSCGNASLISNVASARTRCTGNTITECEVWATTPPIEDDFPAALAIPEQLELKGTAFAPGAGPRMIEFGIPRELEGRSFDLTAYDVTGRRLRTVGQGVARAGYHRIAWDLTDQSGSTLPGGVCFLRLRVGEARLSRTLVVIR